MNIITQLFCLSLCIVGHIISPAPLTTFFMGWCSAFVFVAIVQAVSKRVRA